MIFWNLYIARPTQKLVQPLITLHPGSLGVLWVPRTLVEASSREQWRLIRLCGCADWSVFTRQPYRKIHCLFVCCCCCFSFPTINVQFSLMLGKSLWYALVRIWYITEHILPTTLDATVDLRLPVTWIERSVCAAPGGSADRRELKKYEHVL